MWHISSIIIKDICEVINNNLIIFFSLLQIRPKNLGNINFLIIIFIIMNLLYNINNKIYFILIIFNFIIFHPTIVDTCHHLGFLPT
jgi:hypothetical protein